MAVSSALKNGVVGRYSKSPFLQHLNEHFTTMLIFNVWKDLETVLKCSRIALENGTRPPKALSSILKNVTLYKYNLLACGAAVAIMITAEFPT